MSDPARSSFKSSLVTVAAAGTSVLCSAPPFIAEVFSWMPKSMLDRASLSFSNFIGLCEIGAAIGDFFYLPLAFVLNVYLLFRRQAPVWLKVAVWAFFVVAVFGAMRVDSELRHVRR